MPLIVPISSILDTDLYKLTMQQAVLELFPSVNVTYQFINRNPSDKFSKVEVTEIQDSVKALKALWLKPKEKKFLQTLPYFKPAYLEYLQNYRFDPSEVTITHDDINGLQINIAGPWHKTIMWEVPLMAIVSESYFNRRFIKYDSTSLNINKVENLTNAGCMFAEFGTRRRRCTATQGVFLNDAQSVQNNTMIGTSNIFMAQYYKLKPVGSVAHEFIMAHSALCSLKHANKYAMDNWVKVYKGQLGIALTDTFGTQAFLDDFDLLNAKIYDGVRHDSGNPYQFTDKIIDKYKQLGINPLTKMILFSDGLTVDDAIKIKQYCDGKIMCSFGIGTHFSNDVPGSKALNIVIKLRTVDGVEVVKLSDNPGKAAGDAEALKIARKTFGI